MKTRITYLQPPSSPFTSTQANLTPTSLRISDLDAAKEVRVTVDVAEVVDDEVGILPFLSFYYLDQDRLANYM